jgi:hypothetical protein
MRRWGGRGLGGGLLIFSAGVGGRLGGLKPGGEGRAQTGLGWQCLGGRAGPDPGVSTLHPPPPWPVPPGPQGGGAGGRRRGGGGRGAHGQRLGRGGRGGWPDFGSGRGLGPRTGGRGLTSHAGAACSWACLVPRPQLFQTPTLETPPTPYPPQPQLKPLTRDEHESAISASYAQLAEMEAAGLDAKEANALAGEAGRGATGGAGARQGAPPSHWKAVQVWSLSPARQKPASIVTPTCTHPPTRPAPAPRHRGRPRHGRPSRVPRRAPLRRRRPHARVRRARRALARRRARARAAARGGRGGRAPRRAGRVRGCGHRFCRGGRRPGGGLPRRPRRRRRRRVPGGGCTEGLVGGPGAVGVGTVGVGGRSRGGRAQRSALCRPLPLFKCC